MHGTGITGLDVIEETIPPEEVVREVDLGFGKCKLGILAPVSKYKHPKDLAGKRIVTSFPNCTHPPIARSLGTRIRLCAAS